MPGGLEVDTLAAKLATHPADEANDADACFAGADWSPRTVGVAESSLLAVVLTLSPAVLREWTSNNAGRDEEKQPGLGGRGF